MLRPIGELAPLRKPVAWPPGDRLRAAPQAPPGPSPSRRAPSPWRWRALRCRRRRSSRASSARAASINAAASASMPLGAGRPSAAPGRAASAGRIAPDRRKRTAPADRARETSRTLSRRAVGARMTQKRRRRPGAPRRLGERDNLDLAIRREPGRLREAGDQRRRVGQDDGACDRKMRGFAERHVTDIDGSPRLVANTTKPSASPSPLGERVRVRGKPRPLTFPRFARAPSSPQGERGIRGAPFQFLRSCSSVWKMSGIFDLALPLMRLLPPEAAHRATIRALATGLAPKAACGRSGRARDAALGSAHPQSRRPRRRLRQGCGSAGCDAGFRLRLRRMRHDHAAAATRQPQAAALPPAGRPSRHQSPRLQQRRASRRRRGVWRGGATAPASSAPISARIATRSTTSAITSKACACWRRWSTT